MALSDWEKVSRSDPDYRSCLVATTAVGAVIGGATGLGVFSVPLAFGGAAWGFAGGFLACPYLVPMVKTKIEQGLPLSHHEVESAAEAMGRYADLTKGTDALKLVALVRNTPANPGTQMCGSPRAMARQLLG